MRHLGALYAAIMWMVPALLCWAVALGAGYMIYLALRLLFWR